jgi:ubiquitin carboxyl-terminal hydrolase 14
MVKLDVSIKHSGKVQKLVLDTDAPPVAFKQIIQDLTGVPVERMKVMIKGGVLKVFLRKKQFYRIFD